MAINSEDGDYAIDCWVDPNNEGVEPVTFYSDDQAELEQHALNLLAAETYAYIVMSQWSEEADDWQELEDYTEDDLEDAA